MILFLLFVVLAVTTAVFLFLRQRMFGKSPAGERLERIKRSPHYRNGQFHNLSPTPMLTEGASYFNVMKKFFFGKSKRAVPLSGLPSTKTDLLQLDPEEDLL